MLERVLDLVQTFDNWVIGIGASAGGLEALGAFVSNIPAEFNGAIIIAQHLAPHSKSMMVELLQRQSNFPVVQAENRMPIEPATIYVVPPNHDLSLIDSKLCLVVADEAIRPKPSVNGFFASLAAACGSKCIGIILSGTGSDGSTGIEAIKAAGGITLAQDDQSAKYDGMPRSAVGTGKVDSILPPDVLAKSLPKIIRDHENRAALGAMDPGGLRRVLEVIREKLGQDFRQYKSSTIGRRVAKRMNTLGVQSYEEYAEVLNVTPGEIGEVAEELLISVTEFFRDHAAFETLRNLLTEQIRTAPAGKEFRAWVAGCATGEEAYTLAFLFLDIQERLHKTFPVKIFATDLDHDAIQEARNGVYAEKDIVGLPGNFAERFFMPHAHGRVEVVKRARDCVVFARQDMIQNPPFVKLDLITCRNVLIYFEPELQRKVFEIFHYALAPAGVLFLGQSESVAAAPSLFNTVDRKAKLYEKSKSPSVRVLPTKFSRTSIFEMPERARHAAPLPAIELAGYKKLLQGMEISGAIVDSHANLVQVFGDVSGILQLQNRADLRLPMLLPKGVGVDLPILLRRVAEGAESVKSRTHRVGTRKTGFAFQITVEKLFDENEGFAQTSDLFLVTFEKKKSKLLAEVSGEAQPAGSAALHSRIAELEEDLMVTKEHLQTVIEELGVSNEELQSLNEELSSTNEELQATNEELETTNEELQSSNEELTTVNEEVAAKNSEIRSISLGLENIQNSIGSPIVVLDSALRLVRYNLEATKIFQLSDSDISRDIRRISSRCEIPDFIELTQSTLTSGEPSETLCESLGVIYQVRIVPSYDEKRKIIGIILNFIDNTARIRIQEQLVASEERTRAIIEASPSLICLKDTLGRYLLVNSAFKTFFRLGDNVVGKTDRELLAGPNALQLRDEDLEVMMTRTPSRKEELLQDVEGRKHVLLSNRFPVFDLAGKTPIAVGTIAIDITGQVEAQEALKKSEAMYRAIAEDQAVFVSRQSKDGHLTYVNDAFAHFFKQTAKAIVGRSFLEFTDALDRRVAGENLRHISFEHPIEQSEMRAARGSTEKRWIRWIHRGVFDAANEVAEIQSVGFDVTDYRTQTDRLREKEAVFTGIFDNTSDYISLYRLQGDGIMLESMNRSAEKLMGNLGNQIVGRSLESFFGGAEGHELVARYQKTIHTGLAQSFEEEVYIAGRVRHFLTTIVPIPNDSGTVDRVAALSRDVSTYKQIEVDMRKAMESAEVANRAKSEFLAAMSHELRTPLNVVLGFSQMLEFSQLDAEQKNFVGGIHRSGQLLLSLIEDILDISKIEAGKIRLESVSFSISEFLDDVLQIFKAQAKEKGVELVINISHAAVRNVLGDPNRLRQVLVNFVGNALKFTGRGKVEVEVSATETREAGERMFTFSVRDTGIGIQDADKNKIFHKFSQAESGHARRFGGSGLGLAISKHLIGLMGGDVGFESQHGSGSRFWFTVPLVLTHQASEVRALAKANGTVQPPERPLNILVVDDSADSRAVAGLFLERLGHVPELVDSGADAIRQLREKKFDLVLMDMQMPIMDGCDTTRFVRKEISRELPIIALTANALTEDVDRCLEAGMSDYLSKPVRVDDLNHVILKWHRMSKLTSQSDSH